jgi:lysozyme family protein
MRLQNPYLRGAGWVRQITEPASKEEAMTAATYDASMVRVYADEGGFGIDRLDPGGATTYGITIIDARKYAAEFGWIVRREVTVQDMRVMPKWFAAKVYERHYAAPMRYNDLPAGFDYSVFDAAINSGVGRAPIWAAKAIGISDKSIDTIVKQSNATIDKVSMIQKYWAVRLAFLHGLGTWSHFGGGWGRRCAQGEAAAVKMWMIVGAAMSSAAVQTNMKVEANKAKTKSKQATTAGAGTGAGTAASPTIDHASMGGKIMLGLLIAAGIALVIYFIRKAIVNNQRATAYAAA